MKNAFIFLFSILFTSPVAVSYGQGTEELAESVLRRLYAEAGRTDKPIPSLSISRENRKVAAYYPARHQIVLDEKAFENCRAMGRDFRDALAFILSHELAHAFEPALSSEGTNFLVYGLRDNTSDTREKAADIRGAFTAYLAGYRIEEVVPEVLERIYKAYGLWGKPTPGYPSFEERSNSVREVMDMARRLIAVFEAANYLTLLEYYEEAVACNTFLLDYYQGREIYNNLGVLHVLHALQYYDEEYDRFAYPLELETASRLQELERQRGAGPLGPDERERRTALLQAALSYFHKALERDEGYLAAVGNLACALNLLGRPEEAMALLQNRGFIPEKANKPPNLEMAYAISCALLKDKQKAGAAFSQLLDTSSPLYAQQAQYNLNTLEEQYANISSRPPLPLPVEAVRKGKALELSATGKPEPFMIHPESNLSLIPLQEGNQSSLSFWDATGPVVSLVRWKAAKDNSLPPLKFGPLSNQSSGWLSFPNILPAPDGFYIRSGRDGLLVKAGKDGQIEEIVRWIRHR
ncbi:MAG: hypothetical protein H6558_11450 [Lewinellaceae bacterium]|nr:hypothetical protein [Lewinellaceae bacterium]